MGEYKYHRVGDSWPGRGDHAGHTITAIEWWPAKMHDGDGIGVHCCSGRVRCSCAVEWDTSIWPPVPVHVKRSAGRAMCDIAGPGDLLTGHAAEVTCPDCIEWAHA